MKDITIMIVTHTSWNEPPRIRHQIAQQMSRFYKVIFVEIPTCFSKRCTIIRDVNNNIVWCQLGNSIIISPRIQHYLPLVKNLAERYIMGELYSSLSHLFSTKVVLINFNFDFVSIMKSSLFCLKVFFCNDDFPGSYKYKILRKIAEHRQNRVVRASDCCFAVSYPLINKIKKINQNAHLLLPGHNFEIVEPLNFYYKSNKRIRVAFMGFVNERINVLWLKSILEQKDMELHLIGPLDLEELLKYTSQYNNLYLHGTKLNGELYQLMMKMDVMIMPYRTDMKIIQSVTAPNKLFQYIACGKPIVISNMPYFIKLGNGVIYKANTANDFIDKIRTAHEENNIELCALRYDIARNNTWNARGEEMQKVLESYL